MVPELTERLLQAHACSEVILYRPICGRCCARERDCFKKKGQNFEDAPHGSAVLKKRTMKFRGCSARERSFLDNFQDAPHGSAIFFQIFRMLRTGARFSSIFQDAPHGSAVTVSNKRMMKLEDTPHGSAVFLIIFRMLRTGARFSSKFSGCSAREDVFLQFFLEASHGSAACF